MIDNRSPYTAGLREGVELAFSLYLRAFPAD